MKTLYIVRHAKSSWDDLTLDDFDRPLNKRGKHDAPLMGNLLNKMGVDPELMLSSPAKRAKATAIAIAEQLDKPKKDIVFNEDIYHASASELIRIISKTDKHINSLMLFGHNPGLTFLANRFFPAIIDNIPTTGVVAVELSIESWSEIEEAEGRLVFFEYPKKHY